MGLDITQLLKDYAKDEPRRATGGIYAMAGFAFQAQVYVADLAEAFAAAGPDLLTQGQTFVEALSDIAKWDAAQGMILLQAKRTLTSTTLDAAAGEIAAIEAFVNAKHPALAGSFKYGVVSVFNPDAKGWTDLPKTSIHTALIQGLQAAGRLLAPYVEQDPAWRTIAALWRHVDNPYDFARFAFERALLRQPDPADAKACRDAIAERFMISRRNDAGAGLMLSNADFEPEKGTSEFHLEVGRQVTLARVRAGQYMPRDQRVQVLAKRAAELSELAAHEPNEAMKTLWLSGRSGAGKSVLLLQLLQQLVYDGRRVLWLRGDAGLLERVLRDLINVAPEHVPEFIAVDDVYDRDAREQLDLYKLANYIDEQGRQSWPVLLTCGPTEFADAFDDGCGRCGFDVERAQIELLDQNEASEFLEWVNDRRDTAVRSQGEAFEEAQHGAGLFVSMASELAFGTLNEFGAHFKKRLASLKEPLRPLLALNRLYLRAPYHWLDEADCEKLEALNIDGDFSIFEFDSGSKLVRLTHPHLSDFIYKALLQSPTPLAYTNDLSTAFKRSVDDSDYLLSARLLRTFSATDSSLVYDRLKHVNLTELAKRCVKLWASATSKGDLRIQLDVAISWACWPEAHASLKLSKDALIQAALEALDRWRQSDGLPDSWATYWWRLWRSYPNHSALAAWAEKEIGSEQGMQLLQWSRIWELLADQPSATPQLKPALAAMAKRWLARDYMRTDWHFVWKKLKAKSAAGDAVVRESGLALLAQLAAPRWAYVFHDMLALVEKPRNEATASAVVGLGCAWLEGREWSNDWPFAWRALLDQPALLPAALDERALLILGNAWLIGKEDHPAWNLVWEALLERAVQYPQCLDEPALEAVGYALLAQRTEFDGWSRNWDVLLKRARLLKETEKETTLVVQGCVWLTGREDSAGWGHVWLGLLEQPSLLPSASDERVVLAQGVEWLTGREDHITWGPVWQCAFKRAVYLKDTVIERQLVQHGWAWLTGREDATAWTYVWRTLLERPDLLATPADESALVAQGCSWLAGRVDEPGWTPVLEGVLSRKTLLSAQAIGQLQVQLEAL